MKTLAKAFGLLLLIVLSPFLILIALISLLSQGRPIIYKQTRIGLNFSPFTIYKFRSMHQSSEGINSFSTGHAYTATSWGQFIRKTKIDELPQLLNILKGDMAFIGPRPELPEFIEPRSFQYLNKIKPGLSGYSSILFRDESLEHKFLDPKNSYKHTTEIKTFLDNYYMHKKGLIEDLKLIIFTILSIFFPKSMTIYFSKYLKVRLHLEGQNLPYNVAEQIDIDAIKQKEQILGSN
jgi:lipopolysaccharide/colanic/teichoic acid biosynthesis glycosyltransferase